MNQYDLEGFVRLRIWWAYTRAGLYIRVGLYLECFRRVIWWAYAHEDLYSGG